MITHEDSYDVFIHTVLLLGLKSPEKNEKKTNSPSNLGKKYATTSIKTSSKHFCTKMKMTSCSLTAVQMWLSVSVCVCTSKSSCFLTWPLHSHLHTSAHTQNTTILPSQEELKGNPKRSFLSLCQLIVPDNQSAVWLTVASQMETKWCNREGKVWGESQSAEPRETSDQSEKTLVLKTNVSCSTCFDNLKICFV